MRTLAEALEALDADPDDAAALADLREAFEAHPWEAFPFIDPGHVYWLEGRVRDRARSVDCQRQHHCLLGFMRTPCRTCGDFWASIN
jgi:hypothetical protein